MVLSDQKVTMRSQVEEVYGNRVRVRVCGLCYQNDALLLVNHQGLTEGDFWAPPGGGVEYGEHLTDRLVREFRQETGLVVSPGEFRFGCEYIHPPLHAIELFYEVKVTGGTLRKGDDPELSIIADVRFMTPAALAALPATALHGIFRHVRHPAELKSLNGFFRV